MVDDLFRRLGFRVVGARPSGIGAARRKSGRNRLLCLLKPVDFAFEKIFGSPENVPILIGLLNAMLKLANPIVHVEILNPFSYQDFVFTCQSS
jgi:hypothetical protein